MLTRRIVRDYYQLAYYIYGQTPRLSRPQVAVPNLGVCHFFKFFLDTSHYICNIVFILFSKVIPFPKQKEPDFSYEKRYFWNCENLSIFLNYREKNKEFISLLKV